VLGSFVRFWPAGSTAEGNANPRRKSSHSQPITSVEIFGNERVERYSVDGSAEGYVRFDLRRDRPPRHLKRVRGLPPSIPASTDLTFCNGRTSIKGYMLRLLARTRNPHGDSGYSLHPFALALSRSKSTAQPTSHQLKHNKVWLRGGRSRCKSRHVNAPFRNL